MGFYHYVVALGTILFIAFIWVGLNYAYSTTTDKLADSVPNTSYNYSVNQTDIRQQYDVAEAYAYYSFFFIVFLILAWVIKVTVQEQKRGNF